MEEKYCTYHQTRCNAATVVNPTCRDELHRLARQGRFVLLDQIGAGGNKNTKGLQNMKM